MKKQDKDAFRHHNINRSDKQLQTGTTRKNNKKQQNKNKKRFNFSNYQSSPYKSPLGTVFHIPMNEIKDFAIGERQFTSRTIKILYECKCFTFKHLLSYSINDIKAMSGVGNKTCDEIVQFIYHYALEQKYVSNHIQALLSVNNDIFPSSASFDLKSNKKSISRDRLHFALKDFWTSGTYSEYKFSTDENYCIKEIINKVSVLDNKLCLQTIAQPFYIFQIVRDIEDLNSKICFIARRKSTTDKIRQLPRLFMHKPIFPFVKTYYLKTTRTKCYWLENVTQTIQTINLPDYLNSNIDRAHMYWLDIIDDFIEWLNFDIDKIADDIFYIVETQDTEIDRWRCIFKERVAKTSLNILSKKYNLNRERIRQLENKFIDKFLYRYRRHEYNLLHIIWAIYNGTEALSKGDICTILGNERADTIWYIATKGYFNNNLCQYSNELDAILFGVNYKYVEIKNVIQGLPPVMKKAETNSILENISRERHIPIKILSIELSKQYIINQSVCYKPNCFPRYLYSYILLNFFKTGYKIDNAQNAETIRLYMKNLFNKQEHISNHSIDAQIMQVGLLCDRGMYMHPSYMNVSNEIITMLKHYILASERERIAFKDMFNDLQMNLSNSQIKNRYILKSVIDHYQICTYKTDRDYIYKV